MARDSRHVVEPVDEMTRPGNKFKAVLGNLVMWCALLGAVLFAGWGITVIFGGLTS